MRFIRIKEKNLRTPRRAVLPKPFHRRPPPSCPSVVKSPKLDRSVHVKCKYTWPLENVLMQHRDSGLSCVESEHKSVARPTCHNFKASLVVNKRVEK